jgi:hypothetical protein
MTYTIAYTDCLGIYSVHVGTGTMYNMADCFKTYEKALECARSLANAYKATCPNSTVKVVEYHGLLKPATELFTI